MIKIDYKEELPEITLAGIARQHYPVLGKSITDGHVVLFSEPGKGIVIISGEGNPVATYRTNWAPYRFIPYDGEITLKNMRTREQFIDEYPNR